MTLETMLVWLVVGLISGWLASVVLGGGMGLVGNIVVGIVGAFIGGFVFRQMHWSMPLSGIAGTIVVAFIGALLLLLVLGLFRRGSSRA